jgi:hypothetical protein
MSIHVLFAIFAGKLIETEVSVVHNQPLIPTSVTYLKGQSHEIFDPRLAQHFVGNFFA